MRTFEEILSDVATSCNMVFFKAGYSDHRAEVIEAATKIYIAELEADAYQKSRESLF